MAILNIQAGKYIDADNFIILSKKKTLNSYNYLNGIKKKRKIIIKAENIF